MSSENEFIEEEEEELFVHHEFIVDKGQQLLRIDKYLQLKIANASRNKIQSGIEAGSVKVNNIKITKSNYKVHPFDKISISFAEPPRDKEVYPEEMELNILFEDEDLIFVDKPAGMVVHPAHGNWNGTLVNGLLFHCNQLPDSNGEIRPGLVHRIDKDTSGILVIAKNEFALSYLGNQFFEHTIERTYFAIVWGVPKERSGKLVGKIARSPRDRKVMMMYPADSENGKTAITHYEVMEEFGFCSLVKFNLETGRTHQIRAHASSIQHPIFSDSSYGGDKIRYISPIANFKALVKNLFDICPRQALHAQSLEIIHPKTKQKLRFESKFPDDMKLLLEKLRNL